MTPHGEKVRAGLERARAHGARIGRRPNAMLTPEALERSRAMRAAGKSFREIATVLGVPTMTLHRALRREVAALAAALAEGDGDA